jgi:hypothetical protein
MAMKTRTAGSQVTLKRRIKKFYDLLNASDVGACFEMIDPRIREKHTSVTLLQYANSVKDFLSAVRVIEVQKIDLELHVDEPNQLYGDRDFAVGQTHWTDRRGNAHTFTERWVRDGRSWYTRCTGFVAPAPARASRS